MDVEFVGQLIDSMGEAVNRLEAATTQKNFDEVNKLRTFIFDLTKQIDKFSGGNENV